MKIKTIRLILSWVGCALTGAALITSCSNDDILQGSQKTRNAVEDSMTFSGISQESAATRTIIYDHTKGGGASVIWKETDNILVKDNSGQWRQSATATFPIASKKSNALFKLPGRYTGTTHDVVYTNKALRGSQPQVEIKNKQTQSAPNNFDHAGESGDCGIATATKMGNDYKFTLEHKASYICLIPRSSNAYVNRSKIIKIEISSEDNIAGVYNIATDGTLSLASGGSKTITLTTGSGFDIDNTTADMSKNASYAVIAPGTHNLRIRYWLRNTTDNPKGFIDGTVTKYVTLTFVPGSIHDITANLNINDFGGTNYYLWDAKKNFWDGHEWNSADPWQPTKFLTTSSQNYPLPGSDSYNRPRTTTGRFDATTAHFAALPNANEMAWYVLKGDPHSDADELWSTMGYLYKGGMWFKKKANIAGFSDSHHPDNASTDLRDTYMRVAKAASQQLPVITEMNQYFYLPFLGYYSTGSNNYKFQAAGVTGYYWTSSAVSSNQTGSYALTINKGLAALQDASPSNGMIIQPFE
jgi:hypothetical protein